jgi:hypothetical protein
MRLVVTRPQTDSERTAAALRACGHAVLVAPLLRVEPVATDLSGAWGAVIITSANAPGAVAGNPARELLVNDYSRKGYLDGRAVRLPTIVVRPGRPMKGSVMTGRSNHSTTVTMGQAAVARQPSTRGRSLSDCPATSAGKACHGTAETTAVVGHSSVPRATATTASPDIRTVAGAPVSAAPPRAST